MTETRYFAPTEMGEALKLLAENGSRVTVLAGGTDLVPKLNYYEFKPDTLLYMGNLGLDYIKAVDGRLAIGATTSTAKVAASELVGEKAAALAEGARLSGSVATRTTATIGGNIVNASPAADMITPLLVMDAEVRLISSAGERVVPLKDFFVAPNETMRKSDELLVEVSIPMSKGKTVFYKLGRRKALTLSVVNVAVRLEMDGKTCKEARIAVGSVAPTPKRCTQAEAVLEGKELTPALIRQCAVAAVAETSPIDDQRASAWYRRKAAGPLVARSVAKAAGIELE